MTSDFLEHLLDLFADMDTRGRGPVRARRMFGGHGLYAGERMFGLFFADELYLKVDDANRVEFEAEGGGPFVYTGRRGAKPVVMSYHRPPAAALDDSELLHEWARKAIGAADRASKPKKPKRSRPKASGGSGRSRPRTGRR